MMNIIKKYWKVYLEELWYMNLFYWFVVFFDHYCIGNDLDILQPTLIVIYVILAGVNVWIKNVTKN